MEFASAEFQIRIYSVNPVGIFIESIITDFILYIKKNQQTACNTDRQSENVNKGIHFVAKEISKCDL